MEFVELIKRIELGNINTSFHETTITKLYENVSHLNYKEYIKVALSQIRILFKNEYLHGFYIAEWRINFSNLFDYTIKLNDREKLDIDINEFIDIYDNQSAPALYRRLGIEY
jgi:hypothetical protein